MSDPSSKTSSVALVDRKLTPEESRELKILLLPCFHAPGSDSSDVAPEDINDFLDYVVAMVNNNKDVGYMIKELVGMEMEFCNQAVAEKVGEELSGFLAKISGAGNTTGDEPSGTIASLKPSSSEKGNALTMSGALGASREGGRNKNLDNQKAKQGDNNKNNNNKASKRDDRRNDRDGRNSNRRGRGDRGRGGQPRATHREAFDRLAGGTKRDGHRRGRGGDDGDRRHRREDDRRGGRGSRDDRREGRGGRDGRMSGSRRPRDAYEERGRGHHDEGRGRGGRGRGGDGAPKRQRYDDYYDEGYGGAGYYDEGYGYDGYYDHSYGGRGRFGRGRGRFGGRGGRGGRGRGRGRGEEPSTGEAAAPATETTASAGAPAADAAYHPSPLVQASYSGRGGRFGGRGRFGRGRGGRGGRTHVVNMIQSKTWVRKKPEDAAPAPAPSS